MSNRSQSIAFFAGLLIWLTYPTVGLTDEALQSRLERTFSQTIQPFIKQYCIECHGPEKPKAKFNIGVFVEFEDIVEGYEKWDRVLEMLQEGEMPPEETDAHPSEASVSEVVEWIKRVRKYESVRNAGDPGQVLAHRLSNAEYNYTIRDLTGVDLQPTREFPVDPANQAGFDNSGESLRLSPGLLTKYMQAAHKVAEHLVLKPNGLDWSQHPVVTDTDRDKYAVLRIIEFYRKQPTDLADYFYAAWQYLHATEDRSIAIVAAEAELSSKYLQLIWNVLNEPAELVGPIFRIQGMWRALPSRHESDEVQEGCEGIRDYIKTIRSQLEPKVENLEARGIHRGSQPFVMWKNRQYSTNRRRYNLSDLMTQSQIDDHLEAAVIAAEKKGKNKRNSRKQSEKFSPPHPDLILPEDPQSHP
ncbi:MAG TPA: DUF1587 domain-containing protein, partial [Verrucomicrobia bacterium]|nr:DUF1587 domain-containing protein [Verrucomicrobiota bacterium]